MFFYLLIRFRKWYFGAAAVAGLSFTVIVVLAIFSLLNGILPFSLDVDQAFIAAILTVVGYSINDTVIVFDRIREYLGMYSSKKEDIAEVINTALNNTLSRTIVTSLSTLLVLVILFVFGGEVIRGFSFAMLIGIIVGTFASLFVASPIVVDLTKRFVKENQEPTKES
jgi:SecD/SecF fusion protein